MGSGAQAKSNFPEFAMKLGKLIGALGLTLAAGVTAPFASASATSFCDEVAGQWDGQYCHLAVHSERNAVRDIKVAVPGDLVDNPAVHSYLTTLVGNWKRAGQGMAVDSWGESNYEVFRHGDTVSAVFHETYHADGPDFNNAYRTFTFGQGRQLQLSDVLKPGADLGAIPPLAAPFIEQALDAAPPPHQAGSYPFIPDRWTPDKVYSGGYKAWALTPNELVLYMPDYPVGHDTPVNYTPGVMQWSMDGGTVQAHIPLSALAPILRPEFT